MHWLVPSGPAQCRRGRPWKAPQAAFLACHEAESAMETSLPEPPSRVSPTPRPSLCRELTSPSICTCFTAESPGDAFALALLPPTEEEPAPALSLRDAMSGAVERERARRPGRKEGNTGSERYGNRFRVESGGREGGNEKRGLRTKVPAWKACLTARRHLPLLLYLALLLPPFMGLYYFPLPRAKKPLVFTAFGNRPGGPLHRRASPSSTRACQLRCQSRGVRWGSLPAKRASGCVPGHVS